MHTTRSLFVFGFFCTGAAENAVSWNGLIVPFLGWGRSENVVLAASSTGPGLLRMLLPLAIL